MTMNVEVFNSSFVLRRIVEDLPRFQYRFGNETELHNGIAKVLEENKIPFLREYAANAADRYDFLCEGVVIEAKIKGSFNEAVRQCDRYSKNADVKATVLVTSRFWGRSPPVKSDAKLQGKPFRVVQLRGMSF